MDAKQELAKHMTAWQEIERKPVSCASVRGGYIIGARMRDEDAFLSQAINHESSAHLTIWNWTADRPSVKAAVDAGATFEPDIGFAVLEALKPIASPDFLAGKTIINQTNGTPKQAEEMNTWMKQRGATAYFNGAVMVSPEMTNSPHSLLIYSGESHQLFDSSLSQLVAPLGNALYYSEGVGAAAAVDLAALAGMYGLFLWAFTGMNMLKKRGMQAGPATEQVTEPIVAALTEFLTMTARKMNERDWLRGRANPLVTQLAGLRNTGEACEEVGEDGAPFELFAGLLRQAVDKYGRMLV